MLRPVGTKAVDASLLPARMLVPEPMRPGWSASLRMAASRMPHRRLLDIDARMEPPPGRRHAGGSALVLLPHHRYVCTRHNIWIGPPDVDHLSTSPDELPP
ncbi:hypothetical protein [Streptomyces erythrochromogenes]|uniref:hypothetical protein n=1 Tax=Streptomyces erythrochromogenes TaxID=285574 RepID=UPI00031CB567